jgi:hypothetical protein
MSINYLDQSSAFLVKAKRYASPKRLVLRSVQEVDLLANSMTARLRFGAARPMPGELLYIPPKDITHFLVGGTGNRRRTGYVTVGGWYPNTQPVEQFPKIAFCIAHFVHNVPWDKTGAYNRMLKKIEEKGVMDGCVTLSDVIKRYERVDQMFHQVKERGMLDPAGAAGSEYHRRNGVLVHIDSDGRPIFGLGGCHRFAVARILDLKHIPVLLGMVHPDGVKHLDKYRLSIPFPVNMKGQNSL